MIHLIEIYPYKLLCMQLREQGTEGKCIGIFLTDNARDRQELLLLDAALILDVHDTLNIQDPKAFTEEHGAVVKEFLHKHMDATCLYVCCDSGQSRSAALAAAIVRYFGGDDLFIWEDPKYHPNTLVYTRQLAALGMTVHREELEQLSKISDNALRDAIRRSRKAESD